MLRIVRADQEDSAMSALDQYTRYLQLHGHPVGTIEQYVSYPRRMMDDMELEPHEVTLDHVAEWAARFTWQTNTRRRAINSLRGFFTWACASTLIPSDPLAGMKSVKGKRGLPKPVPEPVVKMALNRCQGQDRWLVVLAAETGLRRSELSRVHRDDPERHTDGWRLRVHGKGDKSRLVPISDDLAQWIRSHYGWVFPSPVKLGSPVIPSVIGKRLKRLLGNSDYTTHQMRHRFATIALARSGDLRAVQELLGHESVATTQIYTLVADERLRAVADLARVA